MNVLLFGLIVLLNGVILWPLLVQDEFAPGELKAGSFDVLDGRTTLLLDDALLNELYPLIDLFAGGQIAIPPGYSAGFPLLAGLEYRVRAISTAAPYVVVGAAVPLLSSVRLDAQAKDPARPPNPAYLVDVRTVSVGTDGHLELRSWDADRPWRADAHRLSTLTSTCGVEKAPLELALRAQDGSVMLRLGRCTGQAALTAANGASATMAVIAGPYSTLVEKTPGAWKHTRRFVDSPVATLAQVLIVVQALVAVLAAGLVSGLVVTASLALASVFFPFEAAAVWLAAGVLGVFVALARLASRLDWRWRAGLGILIASAAVIALANWGAVEPQTSHSRLDLRNAVYDASAAPARCLLTGYSTTADAGLRYGTPGIFGLLDSSCDVCRGATARVAWRGGSFSQIRDTVCEEGAPIERGQEIIFVGGVNDDFQLPLQGESLRDSLAGYFLAARIMFSLRALPKRVEAFDAAQSLMLSIEAAQRNVAGQANMIRRAGECARQRGARLWFFHDYIASDLAAGHSPGRAFLLDQRRGAVESSQARFVSLLEHTAERAGVSWFNDIVHLSTIGHREMERIVCDRLRSEPKLSARDIAVGFAETR